MEITTATGSNWADILRQKDTNEGRLFSGKDTSSSQSPTVHRQNTEAGTHLTLHTTWMLRLQNDKLRMDTHCRSAMHTVHRKGQQLQRLLQYQL